MLEQREYHDAEDLQFDSDEAGDLNALATAASQEDNVQTPPLDPNHDDTGEEEYKASHN